MQDDEELNPAAEMKERNRETLVASNDMKLINRLKSFERTLEMRDAMVKELRNDRMRQFSINQGLQKKLQELQEDLNKEKCRKRPEQSSLYDSILGSGEEEDNSSAIKHIFTSIIHVPRRAMCSVANRITLFTWWVGLWANEGLSIFRIENKWLMLQKEKENLEQEVTSLEEHLCYLQKLNEEKSDVIQRERELNQKLLDQLQKNDAITVSSCDPKLFGRRLEFLFQTMGNLTDSMENLRQKIDGNSEEMDIVYDRIMNMLTSQKRLEKYERTLEERLNHLLLIFHRYNTQEKLKEGEENFCYQCSSYLGGPSRFPFKPFSESTHNSEDDCCEEHQKDNNTNIFEDNRKSTSSDTSHSSTFEDINENGSIEEIQTFKEDKRDRKIDRKSKSFTYKEKAWQCIRGIQKPFTNINYKILCIVLLFALLLSIFSFLLLFDKQSPNPYTNVYYRIVHYCAQIWAVFL